jgi:hypothetical protein
MFHCERATAVVTIRSKLSELVDAEWCSILPEAKLRIQNWPAAFEPDCGRENQENGRQNESRDPGTQDINRAPQTQVSG